MLLSKRKVDELELLALKLNIEPDMLLDALISIGFTEKYSINETQTAKFPTPEEKVKAIEEEALNKGWAYEQLWKKPKLKVYPDMGLVCFVDEATMIGEVTEKHIALIHNKPVGKPVILNFYNKNVEQPWIKKSVVG